MGKCFAFADRACRIQFFDDDPVVLTLFIGDETDKRIMKSASMIEDADKLKSVEERCVKYREALSELITEEKVDAILSRAETADSMAVLEIWQFVLNCLRDQKVKNLTASAR